MKVLLIRPEDCLLDGPWAASKWDRVFDLGHAGAEAYERAAKHFGCPIRPIDDLRQGFSEFYRVRELLAKGLGRLTDRFGLDWWELTAILVHGELERLIVLQEFMKILGPHDEVHVSGSGLHADALRLVLGSRVHIFAPRAVQRRSGAAHYLRLFRKFPIRQLLEIFWDKKDPGYQFRGLFGSRRKGHRGPVVLLPTAYVNVSHTAIAYARSVPEASFLLVATRRSGWMENPPANVATAWLRSYASVSEPARKAEYADLIHRWDSLKKELENISEFGMLSQLGGFDDFPSQFARSLEIRDAWGNVLDSGPVQAVICADDSNPYTHIPLLLAKQRGLPTISCHHGALDGRYMFKRSHADVLFAKGKMEQDYLERVCEQPPGRIEIGAPASMRAEAPSDRSGQGAIVLFSEPYEAMSGRAMDAYRDILPRLSKLAIATARELVIKLHPAESLSERTRFARECLTEFPAREVRIVDGPLTPELLERTWFGITILSTVAVECALRGIPCFLCKWLESSPYGYIDQFTRFGVGIPLQQPDEICNIPSMLENYEVSSTMQENCWVPVKAARLREHLGLNAAQTQVSAE